MCYNLYGNGTEPGPKADWDFLREIHEKFRDLSNVSYAFSMVALIGRKIPNSPHS